MSRKIKVNAHICATCRYRMGFGSQPGKEQTEAGHNLNIACDYLNKTGHSRIFEHGKLRFDPEYCDKYEKGSASNDAWTSDNMTMWKQEEERQKLWKELEDAR
ncbi:MAG: hypothetical protein IIV08_01535 [Selenomonadales bacterium]|nr:hypothetical protein [Selenomonadales bacterium]